MDMTAVISAIKDVGTAAAAVGAAALIVHIGIKAYKWIRGAA